MSYRASSRAGEDEKIGSTYEMAELFLTSCTLEIGAHLCVLQSISVYTLCIQEVFACHWTQCQHTDTHTCCAVHLSFFSICWRTSVCPSINLCVQEVCVCHWTQCQHTPRHVVRFTCFSLVSTPPQN